MVLSIQYLQAIVTWFMVGVIWFVQLVHYPLFAWVGNEYFAEYSVRHSRRTTLLVAPVMLLEVATALLGIWLRPPSVPVVLPFMGFLLLVLIWVSTIFVQVSQHDRLAQRFYKPAYHRLLQSNWLRTVAWSARSLLAAWMALKALG